MIHGKLTAFCTACRVSSTHPLSQCSSAHVNFIVGLIPVGPLEALIDLYYCFINFMNTLRVHTKEFSKIFQDIFCRCIDSIFQIWKVFSKLFEQR